MKICLGQDFIHKKTRWIAEKQKQVIGYATKQGAFVLDDDENVLFFGRSYAVLRKNTDDVKTEWNFTIVPESMMLGGFSGWMKLQGGAIIQERVDYYANPMGI